MARKVNRNAEARKGRENKAAAQAMFKAEQDAINAALKVMTMEEADAIIGEPSADYVLLGKAVQPLHRVLLRLCYNNKLRKTRKVIKAWSQQMLLVSSLVHLAYALGIREGIQRDKGGDVEAS